MPATLPWDGLRYGVSPSLADIYAVGVIAFVLLTGRAPYDHVNQVELMIQHLERPVPLIRVG